MNNANLPFKTAVLISSPTSLWECHSLHPQQHLMLSAALLTASPLGRRWYLVLILFLTSHEGRPLFVFISCPISSSVSFTVIIWFTFCHLDHMDNLLYCFLQWFLVWFCFVFWAMWPQSPLYTHELPRVVWPCSPPMPASHCSWGHRCDHAVMFSSFSIL